MEVHKLMGRIIEGLWDCAYCGTTGIRGGQQHCSNCGRARTKDTTFYMAGQKRYVSQDVAKGINKNPDWLCEYCDNLNPDSESRCVSCGSVRSSSTLNYFQNKAKRESVETQSAQNHSVRLDFSEYEGVRAESDYSSSTRNEDKSGVSSRVDALKKESDFDEAPLALKEKLSNLGKKITSVDWTPIIIFVLIAALFVGLVYLFIPKELELTVTNIHWQRNIDIEEYRTVEENDWYIPAGGRLLYTNREIHHWDKVFDHYETKERQVPKERYVGTEEIVVGYRDLGNGYFEEITSTRDVYETYYETETYQEAVYRDEPVYQTKYYYEIERWKYDRTVTAQANDKHPKWPVLNLPETERESSRKETYTVTGKDEEGEEYIFTLSYAEWTHVHLGQEIKVKISFGQGELISVDENFVVYEQD